MTTAAFKSEVETRLSALSANASITELLQHATMAKGLDVDTSTIQAGFYVQTTTPSGLSAQYMALQNAVRAGASTPDFAKYKMPIMVAEGVEVDTVSADGGTDVASGTNFWLQTFDISAGDNDFPLKGKSATYATSSTAILEILPLTSGRGILTHILTPEIPSSSTIVIYIQVDGVEHVYTFADVCGGNNYGRLGLGGFLHGRRKESTQSTTGSSGWGSSSDYGFECQYGTMISVGAALFEGIGIPFHSSIKVSWSSTAGLYVNTNANKAGVLYATM